MLAPLASEAPEFIIAVMFAVRGKGAAAIGTLIASKVNQWSLLVGSLPVAHFLGGGPASLALDARQIEEFTLTATQTLLGVAIILALRFHWWPAIGLARPVRRPVPGHRHHRPLFPERRPPRPRGRVLDRAPSGHPAHARGTLP